MEIIASLQGLVKVSQRQLEEDKANTCLLHEEIKNQKAMCYHVHPCASRGAA